MDFQKKIPEVNFGEVEVRSVVIGPHAYMVADEMGVGANPVDGPTEVQIVTLVKGLPLPIVGCFGTREVIVGFRDALSAAIERVWPSGKDTSSGKKEPTEEAAPPGQRAPGDEGPTDE